MPTVENTGTYIKRYNFWNPETWTIPSLYWDTFSQEQRIHAICRQLSKVIQYADYLGVNTDDIAARLKAIEDGQLDDFIVAKIEEWFNENQPAIVQAIETLQTQTADLESIIPANQFTAQSTVKDAIDAVTQQATDIESIIPANQFTAQSTVKDAIDDITADLDVINADSWVTTNRIIDDGVTSDKIADGAITSDKIADGAITSDKIANGAINNDLIADGSISESKIANNDILLIFGDSWCNFVDHPNWSIDVAKFLDCPNIINYGIGGATFVSNYSNRVISQIQAAESDLTDAQKANVKYIVIMAGINDHNPTRPQGFNDAVENCLVSCKETYPNALIQWFPTSCAPSFTNNGKWLFSAASFWQYIQERQAGSSPDESANRYCFPSCGIGFYFNSRADIDAFFDPDKLHLNDYGLRAIVPAVLEGFGKINTPYLRAFNFEPISGYGNINVCATPLHLQLNGYVTNLSSQPATLIDYGEGERILLAMVGEQAMYVANGNIPGQHTYPVCAGGNEFDGFDGYAGMWCESPYWTATFDTNSSFSGGTRYLAG